MPLSTWINASILTVFAISFLAWNATLGLFTTYGLPYGRFVLYSTIRAIRGHQLAKDAMDSLQGEQSTVLSYKKFIKSLKGKEVERIDELSTGAKLLWLGSANPDMVIYCFHGGAYVGAAVSGHFAILLDILEEAKKKGLSVSAVFLAYDLAPGGKYPVQLQQAVSGLKHLLEELHIPPANIVLSGDSAGGNLALALMSHVLHPLGNVEKPFAVGHDRQTNRLRGLFLVSPWVTFTYTSSSAMLNAARDFVSIPGLTLSSNEFLGDQKFDNYTTPLLAPVEWWRDLPAKSIGVVAGTYEVFLQDIRDLVDRIKVHNTNVKYFELDGEVHDQAVVDKTLGFKEADSEIVYRNWMLQVLEG